MIERWWLPLVMGVLIKNGFIQLSGFTFVANQKKNLTFPSEYILMFQLCLMKISLFSTSCLLISMRT